MSPEDAEDFAQTIQLRLVERGYDIFHRFSGRSTLQTYLSVVVKRLLLDWQNHQYGRWRPTVATRRLGPYAVGLERLIHRDQYTVDEAVELVSRWHGAQPAATLRHLADQLPTGRRAASDPRSWSGTGPMCRSTTPSKRASRAGARRWSDGSWPAR